MAQSLRNVALGGQVRKSSGRPGSCTAQQQERRWAEYSKYRELSSRRGGPDAADIELNLQSVGRSRGCCRPAYPPREALVNQSSTHPSS
eukprot:216063-Rhodomonas_salina.1